jgi:hypothetical protein
LIIAVHRNLVEFCKGEWGELDREIDFKVFSAYQSPSSFTVAKAHLE